MREIRASQKTIRARARISIEILNRSNERKNSLFQFNFPNARAQKRKKEKKTEERRTNKSKRQKLHNVPFRDGLMSSTVSSFLFLLFDDMFFVLFCFVLFVSLSFSLKTEV